MKFTSGEFTETPHCMFKSSERNHKFKVNRKCVSGFGDAGGSQYDNNILNALQGLLAINAL